MTEKENMLAGEIYSADNPDLLEELRKTKERIHDYNSLRPSETQKMKEILMDLLGHIGGESWFCCGERYTIQHGCSRKPVQGYQTLMSFQNGTSNGTSGG